VRVASLGQRQFPAYLKELSASADPVTRTYRVTFGFASPADANVSPGMTGSAVVDRHRRNMTGAAGLALPSNVIVADADGNPFVWIVDTTTMRVSKRLVELGELSGDHANIVSGLTGGDRIVASGVNSVTDNMLVRDIENN
jgi:multidrug efflux pump subunit AcrA (membrane-fusion protein)